MTHVRQFFGDKVTTWADDDTILASKNVSGSSGIWIEEPLDSPLHLMAGNTYRVGAFLSEYATYYGKSSGTPISFPDGMINGGCTTSGDQFPSSTSSTRYIVDLRYLSGSETTILISNQQR